MAAERAGMSTHTFMVAAISEKAEQAERLAEFVAEAVQRYARIVESGRTIPWAEMQRHLERKVSGQPAA